MTQNLVPQKTDVDTCVWIQNLMWNHFGTLLLKHMFVWPRVQWSCCKLARIRPQRVVNARVHSNSVCVEFFQDSTENHFPSHKKTGQKTPPLWQDAEALKPSPSEVVFTLTKSKPDWWPRLITSGNIFPGFGGKELWILVHDFEGGGEVAT